MSMLKAIAGFSLIGFALGEGIGAHAATFCVSNAGQFSAALSAAQSNGEDDNIYVVAGTYYLSAGLTFNSSEAHGLTLIGGASVGCSSLINTVSTLNGQSLYRTLSINNSNGGVVILRMDFENGSVNDLNGGAGLYLYSANGNVLVGLSHFEHNDGSLGGGFSLGTEHGQLTFVNNLVALNHATDFGGGSLYQGNGEAYVIGNTIADNGNDAGQNTGGVVIGGGAHFTLVNNIVWNNTAEGGYDLYAGASHSRLNNDLGIVGGTMTTPTSASGNLSVDPDFVNCGQGCHDYELDAASRLINAGNDSPSYAVATQDLAFQSRTIGAHVDIGAYESDVLFRDGFGP